jgi:hypothetical protein
LTPTPQVESGSDLSAPVKGTPDSMAELEDILEKLGLRESATDQEAGLLVTFKKNCKIWAT